MILIVDDEPRYMMSYRDELELSGYKVEIRKDVGVAFNFIKEHLKEIDLLITDIMMPPGILFANSDVNLELRTGLHFYELVRQISPQLPILILSNVSDPQIANRIQNEPLCWFIRKEDCLPFELASEIEYILSETASLGQ